jgi:hypothetical protein
MPVETVINATVIWTAAPACPTPKNSGAHGCKRTGRAGTRFRIKDWVCGSGVSIRRTIGPWPVIASMRSTCLLASGTPPASTQ